MGKTPRDDVDEVAAVEREVDELRERTEALLAELEHRIRDGVDRARGTVARVKRAVDVPAHMKALPAAIKRHPRTAAGIGFGTLALAGLGIVWAVRRRRAAARPWNRVRARAAAYRAILADPRAVLKPRVPIWRRLLAAVLVTDATTIARKLVARAIDRVAAPPPALPAHSPLGA